MKMKILSMIMMLFIVGSSIATVTSVVSASNNSEECFGFIISVHQYQSNDIQMQISKLVNELLRNDIEVYWITNQMYVSSKTLDDASFAHNNYFERGSYIVPFIENQSKNAMATTIIYRYYFDKYVPCFMMMQSLENILVYKLVEPKIAIHNGPKVEAYSYPKIIRDGGFEYHEFLSWDEIPEKLNNEEYNVFLWGGGYGIPSGLKEINEPLKTKKTTDVLSTFIKNGGGYVGSCYGAEKAVSLGCDYKSFNRFAYLLSSLFITSYGVVISKVVNSNSPVVYGVGEYLPMWHWCGPTIDWYGANTVSIAEYYDASPVEKYPWNPNATDFMKNMWMRKTIGKTSIVSSELGDGKVVAFGSHPETYFHVEKYSDYNCPVRLVYNSIFYVTSEGPMFVNMKKNIEFSDFEINIKEIYDTNVVDLIEFQCNISNGVHPYTYFWDLGDGNFATISNPSHQYLEPGNLSVILTVIDKNEKVGVDIFQLSVNGDSLLVNSPPDKPFMRFDKNIISVGETVFLLINAVDPDGDLFWYKLKMKENLVSDWKDISLFSHYTVNESKEFLWESKQNCENDMCFEEEGTYYIKIKAVDVYGAEGEWSEPIEIFVTNRPFFNRFINFFKNG